MGLFRLIPALVSGLMPSLTFSLISSMASPSDVAFHVKLTLVLSTLRVAAALGVSSGTGSAASDETTQKLQKAAASIRRTAEVLQRGAGTPDWVHITSLFVAGNSKKVPARAVTEVESAGFSDKIK